MAYSEVERINLLTLVGLYPYRTIVEEFGEYIGYVNLGSLTDKCRKYEINKDVAIEWCLNHGVTYDNYFSFLEVYERPLSRFEELQRRCNDDFSRFRWCYATMDRWSIMERYSISYDEFLFLCKKFECTGRRKWDKKNGKALVNGYYKLTDDEFENRFDMSKSHRIVQKFLKEHREERREYQKRYREGLEDNTEVVSEP